MAIDIVEGLKAIAETRSADGNSLPPGSFNLKECTIQHGDDKLYDISRLVMEIHFFEDIEQLGISGCLLYTSPSPRDGLLSRMPSSA